MNGERVKPRDNSPLLLHLSKQEGIIQAAQKATSADETGTNIHTNTYAPGKQHTQTRITHRNGREHLQPPNLHSSSGEQRGSDSNPSKLTIPESPHRPRSGSSPRRLDVACGEGSTWVVRTDGLVREREGSVASSLKVMGIPFKSRPASRL